MLLDSVKKILLIIKKNFLIPTLFFLFSFVGVAECLINPVNCATLPEIVANDISYANRINGYVRFDLEKKYETYNFLYGGKYYFDVISKKNKTGKEFALYHDQNAIIDLNDEFNSFELDYTLGLIDTNSFSSLNLKVIAGEIRKDNYSHDSEIHDCAISEGLANQLLVDYDLSSLDDLLYKTVIYDECEMTIGCVVKNNSFASSLTKDLGERFIAHRFSIIKSEAANYSFHFFFNPSRYYDNYSCLVVFFTNIYRKSQDPYFTFNVYGSNWIVNDVDWYKANESSGIANIKIEVYLSFSVFSLLAGLVIGVIYRYLYRNSTNEKTTFRLFAAASFFYFLGLFVFGFIFNNMFISVIHINVFSSYASYFCLFYYIMLALGTTFAFVLLDRSKKIKLETNPLVSIVIPVYNGENYLKESVESALNQTYENIEVVIVNDGSTDGGKTELVANSFTDKRVHYFSKENGGVASALNYGISHSNGEYICWLSHDDKLSSDKIRSQLGLIQENKDDKLIPYSKNIVIDENGNKSKLSTQLLFKASTANCSNPKDYFKFKRVIFSSLLIPSSFFKENKFDEKLKYSQDIFMFFQILSNGYKFAYDQNGYIYYRVHSSQGSITRVNEIDDDIKLMDKYFNEYYEKTNDEYFVKSYLKYVARHAAGYSEYKKILDLMVENKKHYKFGNFDIFKAKVSYGVSVVLYKIKRKLLGR